MNVTVTDLGCPGAACGYIGIGYPDMPPLVTIYFGVTAKHPTFADAESLAHQLLQAMNDHAR